MIFLHLLLRTRVQLRAALFSIDVTTLPFCKEYRGEPVSAYADGKFYCPLNTGVAQIANIKTPKYKSLKCIARLQPKSKGHSSRPLHHIKFL